MYLHNIDDERYAEARNSCLIDINIATMNNKNAELKHTLTFDALPLTVEKRAGVNSTTPSVRMMTKNRRPQRTNNRGAYNNSAYEPIQCRGCKKWGHKVQRCPHIPLISLCLDYIDKNKEQTAALIREHMRINDRNTKKSTIRLMQTSGDIDADIQTDEYLETTDVDVEFLDVDFTDLPEEN